MCMLVKVQRPKTSLWVELTYTLFAISVAGDKKFLVGDTPCEQDAAIFGLLSAMDWQGHGNVVDATLKSR